MTKPEPAAEDYTEVRIGLPLPIDVAMTLVRALGLIYGDGVMLGPSAKHFGVPESMTVLIPTRARPRALRADECAPVARDELDADVTDLSPDGVSLGGPDVRDVFTAFWPVLHAAMTAHPDATNYLEHEIVMTATADVSPKDPADGPRYVLTIARSDAQTPHALRMAAERAREHAEQDARTARARHDDLARAVSAHLDAHARGETGALDDLRAFTATTV